MSHGRVDAGAALRRDCCHQRRSVKVWLDPMTPPPPGGQSVVIQVSAWAKDGGCA